jgi:hypothetical protein
MTSVAATPDAMRSVIPVLAFYEGRRLLTHPVTLLGWALLALHVGTAIYDDNPIVAFVAITMSTTFYLGIFCVLAAHMVTTRDLRAGTTELVGAVPCSREQRIAALLLAAWLPALLALAVTVLTRQYFIWQDTYVEVPGLAHVLQGPVTVLGGSLLGIMFGVWLPQRVTPVLAIVAVVIGSWALDSEGSRGLFGPLVGWADWGPYDGTVWYDLRDGHPGGHVVYLLGLTGMAAVAAWLRVATHRWLAVALGVVALAVAVWGGVSQLP